MLVAYDSWDIIRFTSNQAGIFQSFFPRNQFRRQIRRKDVGICTRTTAGSIVRPRRCQCPSESSDSIVRARTSLIEVLLIFDGCSHAELELTVCNLCLAGAGHWYSVWQNDSSSPPLLNLALAVRPVVCRCHLSAPWPVNNYAAILHSFLSKANSPLHVCSKVLQ